MTVKDVTVWQMTLGLSWGSLSVRGYGIRVGVGVASFVIMVRYMIRSGNKLIV